MQIYEVFLFILYLCRIKLSKDRAISLLSDFYDGMALCFVIVE